MRVIPITLALLAGPVSSAFAQAILVVPAQYPTIQGAIAAAVNGDTVLVLPGTYPENIDVQGKDIIIRGLAGAAETTIDGGQTARTVLFSAGSTRLAILEGFTVTGGFTTGGTPAIGGGIRVDGSSPTIRDCVVRENTADSYGAGIGVVGTSGPLIERCRVESNHATGLAYASGGGIAMVSATPGAVPTEVRHCTVVGNDGATRGGGIYLAYSPGCIIDGCRVSANTTVSSSAGLTGGAGMFFALNSGAQVTNCRIWNNTSNSDGGGVKWFNVAGLTFVNNTIVDNVGGGAAGFVNGGAFGSSSVGDFVNCILWQNGAGPEFAFGGTGIGGATPTANVDYSIVTGGYAGTGNLNVSPQLLNYAAGNQHLAPASPCIDAGSSTVLTLPPIDMDGDPRVIGANPDIGADEFDPNSPLLFADVATLSSASPGPIDYSVTNGPAGGLFALFFGISGTEPGTPLFGQVAPLNIDPLTTVLVLVGVVDGAGNGNVVLPAFPVPSAFVGVTLSSAAMTFGATIDFTNDENILIVP